jgi:adenine-specific DNA-methyltransferase
MMTEKERKEKISKLEALVKKFDQHIEQYKSKNYKEANLRADFLNPFFEIFDWDISNKAGKAEIYRDVIIEDRLEINGSQKAPDYCFKNGQQAFFYVEAKKPAVDIENDVASSFQLRRYGHTKKLTVSILTNFEEFSIYDTTVKPKQKDKADQARTAIINYKEYVEKFDFFYNIFTQKGIDEGKFDKYFGDSKNKRGTESIDKGLLKLVEQTREDLAKNISKLNRQIDADTLNCAVIKIIDRIIFLRICEDKQIEPYDNLLNVCKRTNVYKNINKIFEAANERYNSGLFEKDKSIDDLEIEDKVLKEIVESFCFPECPYVFSILPVEILGNIYEQFLGSVIRLTPSGQVKIETKPEVKKAEGVYYTPEYIVDYIVQNSVGEKIKGLTPKQIEKIKILDPACGSGSFLISAYQCLLDYHLDYWTKEKHKKKALENRLIEKSGKDDLSFRISIPAKQEILKNNIFGVDIDAQAVEVSKFSLLIKLMEAKHSDSANEMFLISQMETQKGMKILPDLKDNIQCGNSLIGNDFITNNLIQDIKEQKRVKPFEWNEKFSDIMASGGFDIVIGNPPYIKEYTNKEIFEDIKQTKLSKYYQGKMDYWYFFACQAIDLLKDNGLLGYIAPSNWITNAGGAILRNKILTESKILKYLDFGEYKVFENADIQTMIFVLRKEKIKKDYRLKYCRVNSVAIDQMRMMKCLSENKFADIIKTDSVCISPVNMQNQLITFVDDDSGSLSNKIKAKANYYLNKDDMTNGIHHHHDCVNKERKEILGEGFNVGDGIFVINDDERLALNLSKEEMEIIKPAYTTAQIGRYYANKKNTEWVIYTGSQFRSRSVMKQYPNIKKHLDKFVEVITSDFAPYGLHRTRKECFFQGEKILSLRKCTGQPKFTFVNFDSYVSAAFYAIAPKDINLRYLTAILNSKLIAFWLKHKGKMQGQNYQIDKEPLLEIPIYKSDNTDKVKKIVSLVDDMMLIQKQLHDAKLQQDKEIYQQRADIMDKQIDEIVYELYGLTKEEIKIVEGGQ